MSIELVGLIPAAGKGIRLSPNTNRTNKSLFLMGDKPILERNICIMRDKLGIKTIYILVGHKKEQIIDYFGDGSEFGVKIVYIEVDDIDKGLASGILLIKNIIKTPLCVILGDEIYRNSNHEKLLELINKDDYSAICAVKEVKHPYMIKKNYSVDIDNGLITSLIEKPKIIKNNFLGCGTYIFKPTIFEFIEKTRPSPLSRRVELTDVIDFIANTGGKVLPFYLTGDYINVNNVDDYNAANYMFRSHDFKNKKISLIIPAYNEESSIGYVVDDFKGKVDEIIVVNNNSVDDTEKIAKDKGASVLTGSYRGYGHALKVGMEKAAGDILILTEADGSFFARDLGKMLEYLKDADMVLGTRTTKQMIEQAANMSFILRWGNVFVAKLIELLWLFRSEPRLTDVGCTYRGIWKTAFNDIKQSLQGDGPEFSPEMIVEAMRYNKRIIEIPITYSGRVGGESKFSSNILANARTGLKMLRLIFYKKWLDIKGTFKQ